MKEIIVYEGMMCCSSGMCGPEPDQKLIEFNEAVSKLKEENIHAKRVNLSSHVGFFNKNKNIILEIQREGIEALPITTTDEEIVLKGSYPSYEQLKVFAGGSK